MTETSDTTALGTPSDVRAAAEQLKSAIDAHLEAVERSTGEGDENVQAAYDALHRASAAYDDLMYDVHDEVTPWEYPDLPVTEIDEGDEDLRRFALLVRRDYTLADAEALQAAGREAYSEVWPQDPPESAEADVTTAGRAVYQLIHAYGLDGLAERAESVGLAPHGGSVWVQAIADDDDSLQDDDPFEIVDEQALVYRLDEVYGTDDA